MPTAWNAPGSASTWSRATAGPQQSCDSSLLSDCPRSWPDASLPRRSRPRARFSNGHVRTFGAYRDFAGALRATVSSPASSWSMTTSGGSATVAESRPTGRWSESGATRPSTPLGYKPDPGPGWSNEGLFAFLEGLRRLGEHGNLSRLALPTIEVHVDG